MQLERGSPVTRKNRPEETAGSGARRWTRWLVEAGGIGLVAVVLFLTLEGLASVIVAWRDVGDAHRTLHQEYHPVLGWVSIPSFAEPDFWGPGVGLHTNDQGFRARETVPSPLPDRGRILCLGDSYAFGQGVDDSATWCHLLGRSPEGAETVNLGQPGYGLDQSYLRYRSIADSIDHSMVLFTFVQDDIVRMLTDTRFGYPKPMILTSADSLVIDNVPVPRRAELRRWLGGFVEELRIVDLGRRAALRLAGRDPPVDRESGASLERTMAAIFDDLADRVRARDASLVAVYLPDRYDLVESRPLRLAATRLARQAGIHTLDLSDDLRAVPADRLPSLFIPEGAPAAGHYSAEGNRWVADLLRERLPDLARGSPHSYPRSRKDQGASPSPPSPDETSSRRSLTQS